MNEMETSVEQLMETVSRRMRELDHHFYTDRQYSAETGRKAHSESKGNHYWVVRLGQMAGALKSQEFADGAAYLARLEELIELTPSECDYSPPFRAKNLVRNFIASLKGKL